MSIPDDLTVHVVDSCAVFMLNLVLKNTPNFYIKLSIKYKVALYIPFGTPPSVGVVQFTKVMFVEHIYERI